MWTNLQIQQLQAEIRTLNQTISVKQSDLTQLNKDNARLVSELNAARKAAHDLGSKLSNADAKLEAELSVKSDMIERVMAESRRRHDEPAT